MKMPWPGKTERGEGPLTARQSQAAELERVLRHLRLVIFLSKLSQRDIEERLGFSRGHLSQILGGTVELKWWQLLAILSVLEIEPGDFFAELFPRRRHRTLERLDDYRRRSHKKHNPLGLELARLYSYGIESIADFHERLARCEDILEELAALGVVDLKSES